MAESGTYLYAICRGIRLDELEGMAGIRGEPLRMVDHERLSAVVSTVDLAEFGEVALRENLEDLAWVEDVARAHDTVVAAAAQLGPTAPLRLVTVYVDDDGVLRQLRERYDELTESLDRVASRAEWGVKAYDLAASHGRTGTPANETGAAYLTRRRAEQAQRTTDSEDASRLAEQIHALICQIVVASRRLPPQDPRLAGRRETMTLNGTYLVDRGREDELRKLLSVLEDNHPEARIELTGPWPPYSFATLEQP